MTRVDEFDAFYHDSRRQVLHQTYAVTGDLVAAISAVQDAYAHAWQHWTKLRLRDPLAQVRPEAMRLASLRRGTHLLRRRRRTDTDSELLAALGGLTTTARRLVLLQTAAGLDITAAAREVGLTHEDAVAATDQAVAELERALGTPGSHIERRLVELRRVTDAASLPRASVIRRAGTRRKHRNTLVAVATAAAVVVAAGYIVTTPTGGRAEGLHPNREQIGPESAESRVGATEDQLLTASHVTRLDPNVTWDETGTSADLDAVEPYATCARARFGTPQLRQAYIRAFQAKGKAQQSAIEAIEVARTKAAARASYLTQLRWYAGCQEPRVQLIDAYSAARHGSDLRILVLRKWSQPVHTITVGIARSGFVTSTFVHEVERDHGGALIAFAKALDGSLGLLCGNTGGMCQLAGTPHKVAPPVTGEGNGFLGIVDLPPVANLAKRWGFWSPPAGKQNPSSTQCDNARFNGDGIDGVRSRIYVVPEAPRRLREQLGISETIAHFGTENRARSYLERLEKRIRTCDKRNLTAKVRSPHRDQEGPIKLRTWWMSLKVRDGRTAYRLALVRNGSRVAQVMFTPVGKFDVTPQAFNALAIRAGHRLAELE